MTSITLKWLKAIRIPVSAGYFKQKLLSHPDYPSLLSLTDTLDSMGIYNEALQVEKEKADEVPLPFLAHTVDRVETFKLISNKRQLQDKLFMQNWDGIAVIAEKTESSQLPKENNKALEEEKLQRNIWLALMAACTALLSFYIIVNFSFAALGVMLTAVAGMLVSAIIVMQENGLTVSVASKLCNVSSNTDCTAAFRSKAAKLPFGLKLSDASMMYFAGFLATVWMANSPGSIRLLSFISVLSFPVTFISLYYQKMVLKKWCPLCLAIIAVLWAQFILLIPSLSLNTLSLQAMLSAATSFFIAAAAWLFITSLLKSKKKQYDEMISLNRFRRNGEIFARLLMQERKVNIMPFQHEIQLGNPHSPLQLMVACSPYCGPCGGAHKELHEMMKAFGSKIGLSIRFVVNAKNHEEDRTKAVRHMLQAIFSGKTSAHRSSEILHEWYSTMDVNKIPVGENAINESKLQQLLEQHDNWSKEAAIKFTPTVFINGHEYPTHYRIKDLHFLVSGLLENMPAHQQPAMQKI